MGTHVLSLYHKNITWQSCELTSRLFANYTSKWPKIVRDSLSNFRSLIETTAVLALRTALLNSSIIDPPSRSIIAVVI